MTGQRQTNPYIRIRKGWLIGTAALLVTLTACAVAGNAPAPEAQGVPANQEQAQPDVIVATFTPDGPTIEPTQPQPRATSTPQATEPPPTRQLDLTPLASTPTSLPPTAISFGDSAPSSSRAESTEPEPQTNPPNCGSSASCSQFSDCTEVFNYLQSCPGNFDDLDADDNGTPCDAICTIVE